MDNPGIIKAIEAGTDSKTHKNSFCIPIHDSGLIIHWCKIVFSNRKLNIANKGYPVQTPVCNQYLLGKGHRQCLDPRKEITVGAVAVKLFQPK